MLQESILVQELSSGRKSVGIAAIAPKFFRQIVVIH